MRNKPTRNSNIEILRLIAMLLITAHHFALWGFFSQASFAEITVNAYWLQILESLGKIGVFLFMLITGYFSLNSSPTSKKIFQLTQNVRMYAYAIILVIFLVGGHIGVLDVVKASIPVIGNVYWFITAYVIIYAFSGFLASFFRSLSKAEARKLLLMLIVVFLVFPTFLNSWHSTVTDLLPAFFFGMYLKKYDLSGTETNFLKIMTSIAVVGGLLTIVFLDVVANKMQNVSFFRVATHFFTASGSPVAFLIAIVWFNWSVNRKKKVSAVVNWASSSALSIYLIQEHPALRMRLWNDVFQLSHFQSSLGIIPFVFYSLGVVLSIGVLSILIDKLFQTVFKWGNIKLISLQVNLLNYLKKIVNQSIFSKFDTR